RQPLDAPLGPFGVGQAGRVDVDRLARVQLAPDAVQAGLDERAQGQVRVGAGVGRLEFQVDRAARVAAQHRADADRRLPVVHAVDVERAGPHLRGQPPVAVDAGAGQ